MALGPVLARSRIPSLPVPHRNTKHASRMGPSESLTFSLQALLARHEAYMADAERDRLELTRKIEHLETHNRELEAKNASYIEENRSLLDQLECLNAAITDSEGQIKSLEATLLSSQQTIRRLEGETMQVQSLERQLSLMEQEQAELQSNLAETSEEARSAMTRWKRAERGIVDLQEQLERMEQEARTERERHAEMMGRMEKQREVERELNTAAGRLKGAAASRTLNGTKNGSGAVSHFVRDLLQDNTHLQHAISELREMLMNSNDEIQALREKLMYHQPLGEGEEGSGLAPSLRAELESKDNAKNPAPNISQELHVHHHYHVTAVKQEKKPKKKRQGLTPGVFAAPALPSRSSTPPPQWRPSHVSRVKRDSLLSNCWSVQSEQPSDFAPSSAPSSPTSNPRTSIFDPPVGDSYPGSPVTSIDPLSPCWRSHRRNASNVSGRSFQVPTNFSLDSPSAAQPHTILEETDDVEALSDVELRQKHGPSDIELYLKETVHGQASHGRLRRAMSQESIMSLAGGLDIHTLQSRPSQLVLRPMSSATSVVASSTVSAVVARPMLCRDESKRSALLLRDSYCSSPGTACAASGLLAASHSSSKAPKWKGWRPWGGNNTSAPSIATSTETLTVTSTKPDRDRTDAKTSGRAPGINQAGAIPGFDEYWAAHQKRTPSKVKPDVVDQDALREVLAE